MAGKAKKLVQLNFSALCGTGNSPPIIKSGPQSLLVTEVKDNAAGENTLIHKGSGAIKFTDTNVSDVHKATFAALGSGYIGSFSLGKVDQAKDSVPWTFKVADSVIDHLQAGETIIQKYKVVINDGHGGKAVQTVTVKIVGTNDAPIITSPAQHAMVTELSPNDPGENTITHARNGAVTFHDVDTLDTHTATVVPQGGGYLGTFSIGALNQVGDSIPWTFTVPDSVLNSLGAGQTLTQKYNVTVNDGHGGTATQTVTVTIIGTNDPLEIGPDVLIGSTQNLVVDEDGFEFANNDLITARGDETASTNSLTQSGSVNVDFGINVPVDPLMAIQLLDTSALDGQLHTLDGQSVAFALNAGDLVGTVSGGTRDVIRIHIDSATQGLGGNVTYTYSTTLSEPVQHARGSVENNALLTGITFEVTGGTGAHAQGTFGVTIVDDVPDVTVSVNVEAAAALDETSVASTPDTLGVANIGDDPDVAGSGTIAVYTTSGAPVDAAAVFGADGPALHNALIYALEASTADSGLMVTDGSPISLFEEGGVIVGRVSGGGFNGLAAFAIAIDSSTGQLSIEQYLSIRHPDANDENDAVALATGALTITVTATDGDGDSISKAADISAQVTFADEGPGLGPFTPGTLPIQTGTVNGFFSLAPGADGFGHFTITGTPPNGLTYTTSALADGTRLLAETSTGTDVFALNVHSGGTYTFELIAPQAAHCHNVTWTEVDDHHSSSGDDFSEVSHGSNSYEFSSNEDMRNPSSHGHFGEHSDRIDNAPDHFQIEFHDSCEEGDSDENSNAACMDNVSFGTHGYGSVTWVAHDTGHGTSESGHATIYNGHLEIDPTICFNQLDVSWEDGSFGIDDMEAGEHELPQDLNLAFQIALTDGDGDTTAAQTLNIHEVGTQAYGYLQLMGFAGVANDSIASSTMPDAINGGLGFDMADYTDSLAAISINLDDSGNAAGAPVPFSNPPDGTIGGGDAAGDTLASIDGIIGGQGNDILFGNSSANWLFGSGGGDTLDGEDGDDTIGGGLGADTLTGGGGADVFVYSSVSDSPTFGLADTITDFASGTGELIDLHLIDASSARPGNQEFIFIDAATDATVANSITWNQNGGDTFIHADVNGDMVADLVIRLAGLYTPTSADFVV